MDLRGKPGLRPVRGGALALVVGSVGIALGAVACCEALFPPFGQVMYPQTKVPLHPGGHPVLTCLTLPSEAAQPFPSQAQNSPAVEEILSQAEKDFEDGRLDAALAKCWQAIELDSSSAHAYYLLGMIQEERKAHDEAKQALLQSVKLNPTQIASHVYLARLYLVGKEWRAAENEFQAAVRLGDVTGTARFGLALALLAQSRYSDALPHLLAAVEVDARDPERLFTLIATELQLKQVVNARRNMSRLEVISRRDPWVFFRLGKLLQEHGMSKDADAKFERATALLAETKDSPPPDFKLSDLYLEIARLRFERHDYFATIKYLEKIEPGTLGAKSQANALHLEGAALLGFGRVRDSQIKLKQAAERDTENPDLAFRLIWADVQARDMKAATATADAARDKWPELPNIQRILAIVERERAPERARVPFSAEWHLKGEGLVCCPCKVPCPCRSNGQPTYGHCENTGVFRIAQGHYGDISLDGLTFVAVSGSMNTESELPSSLYVEASATDGQLIAIERLTQSFNPLVPFFFLNTKRAPISFMKSPEEKDYEVKIPGVLQIKIQRQLNARGEPLMPTAAVDYFSNTLEYARNLTYKIWGGDGSLKSDYSGRQANYRRIDVDSRDYEERRMLIQFADGSGFFNDKQLELIKSLKLPTLRNYPKPGK